jgi:23S rRNA pseudouridine2604 synthase
MAEMRINKYLAEHGYASRREADALVEAGAVLINGTPAVLGQKVSERDIVTLSDSAKQPKRTYLAYYKGRGIITHSPAAGETDIAAKLASQYNLTGVYPVGRLDKDSEGLMILTNDGRITGPLLDPERENEKEYEVTVDKPITGQFLKQMARGVAIEGYTTKPATAKKRGAARFSLTLTEGKKHQVRRMCAALGYQVKSLKRIRITNIELGSLKPNQFRKIVGGELETFLQTLKVGK